MFVYLHAPNPPPGALPSTAASQLQLPMGRGGRDMLSKRVFTSICAAGALAAAVTATPALAQQPLDSRTEFTFNTPVELPNVTLPPGTYVFRFVDATTGRKVMQVQAKDASSKSYGLFLTISAQRPKASDDAELRFLETPAGAPAAVKTWWYPGNTIGREFIYPKSQARRLAQATNTTVLTTKAETVTDDQMKTADLAYVSPTGQETASPTSRLLPRRLTPRRLMLLRRSRLQTRTTIRRLSELDRAHPMRTAARADAPVCRGRAPLFPSSAFWACSRCSVARSGFGGKSKIEKNDR